MITFSLGLLEQAQNPTASTETTNSVATLETGDDRLETDVISLSTMFTVVLASHHICDQALKKVRK